MTTKRNGIFSEIGTAHVGKVVVVWTEPFGMIYCVPSSGFGLAPSHPPLLSAFPEC